MTSRSRGRGPASLLASRFVMAAIVLVALAGLYAVAGRGLPINLTSAGRGAVAGRAPVTSAVVACAAPGSGGLTGGGVAVANLAAGPAGTPGRAAVTPLAPGAGTRPGQALRAFTQPGRLAVASVPAAPAPRNARVPTAPAGAEVPVTPGRGGVVIQASGSMAPGLDAEQLDPGGNPTARCLSPGTDFWFLAPATVSSQFTLYLMNPDAWPASVTVTALTDSGPLLGKTDAGIAVPPHAMVQQPLGPLLHAARDVAVNVTTSSGRIVAAVRESTRPGKAGSWLPPAQAPATRQVLPGVPGVPGNRELFVAVPGSNGAQVKITAVTSRGSYQPTGGAGVSVPGSSAAAIPLSSLAGVAATVIVSANVPVTAAIALPGAPAGSPGAFAAGAEPVGQQGVVAASPVGGAGSSELILSAPGGAASVRISQAGAGAVLSAGGGQLVQVPAGHSVVVRLQRSGRQTPVAALMVVPQPGSGPVYAARVASSAGIIQSIVPVVTSPAWIGLPAVRSSLVTILAPGGTPHR